MNLGRAKATFFISLMSLGSGFAAGCQDKASANGPPAAPPAGAPAHGAGGSGHHTTALVALAAGAEGENKISTAFVEKRQLGADIHAVGNVEHDADHFAIVGPLVQGRVTRLAVGVGDRVRKGQVLAEIESAEIGEARAALTSAQARYAAAEANLKRETDLAEKRISSAREREMAEAQASTEEAGVRAAEQRLSALGFSASDLRGHDARRSPEALNGRVPLRSPLDGTVIERTVTLGQAVERATDAFKIANLDHLWVQLDLYEMDLARVQVGEHVEIRTDTYPGEIFRARVAYIGKVIDEGTRTARIRVEVENRAGKLRLGQLVSATLLGNTASPAREVLTIPRSALQRLDGKPIVFVKKEGGYERRSVEPGVSGGDRVEIKKGLEENEQVAVEGAFLLKSEVLR